MIPLTAKGLVEKGLVQVCDQAKVPEPCESSANMSMEKFLSGLGEVYKKYLPAFNLHGMKRPTGEAPCRVTGFCGKNDPHFGVLKAHVFQAMK